MDHVEYVRRKADSVFAQISAIQSVEFPYDDPSAALDVLDAELKARIRVLDAAIKDNDCEIVSSACKDVNYLIVMLLPLLGFLLRSTNIRNSFEIFEPVKNLAHMLLDHEPKVVISSEWEFSPFTYPGAPPFLSEFLFIGLPASEAGNALILPLAGHELGHYVWHGSSIGKEIEGRVNIAVSERFFSDHDALKDVFGDFVDIESLLNHEGIIESFELVCNIAKRQCEETFCDAIGVRLFGEAFIHSFEYLLVPSLGGSRSEAYPRMERRMEDMKTAIDLYEYELRSNHEPPFLETDQTLQKRDRFAVEVADDAAESVTSMLLAEAATYCEGKCPRVDMSAAEQISEQFMNYWPASQQSYIGDIVNGGWIAYKEFETFGERVNNSNRAFDILNNLIWKSLEIFEYERKVAR